MKTKLLSVVLVLLTLATLCRAAAPVVANVRASQRAGTQLVDVYYDVEDADSSSLTVSVAVSTNGGASYSLLATSFTGAVGAGVHPGANKQITWNAGADWSGHFSANVRFRVTASDATVPAGMVPIPAGSFIMGDTLDGNPDAAPHEVYVSVFYMDRYEVTKALWDAVYNWAVLHGYNIEGYPQGKGANHPITEVFWYECLKWCNARSEKEGRPPAYYTDAGLTTVYRWGQVIPRVKWNCGYRLPTEAEWEKAARGGSSGHRFPWIDTDNISYSRANYCAGFCETYDFDLSCLAMAPAFHPTFDDGIDPFTSPVGYFPPNGYGLYDMAGNASEWCWDWYAAYSTGYQTDPHGPATGSEHISRGGSWFDYACICGVAARMSLPDYLFRPGLGFRTVLAPNGFANSGLTTVDTRDVNITVSGQVRDAQTRALLAGAAVSLAGQNTSSSAAGQFSFASVALSSGNTLAVSKPGYATYTGTVPAPAGATALPVPDIWLQPVTVGNTNKPVVTSIHPKYDGLFLSGASILNEYTASVNWNGNTPGTVNFYANDTLLQSLPGASSAYITTVDMGVKFGPSLIPDGNKVKVIAVAADGSQSEVGLKPVSVLPLDPLVSAFVSSLHPHDNGGNLRLNMSVLFPPQPIEGVLDIPLLGKYGGRFGFAARYDYSIATGVAEWGVGTQARGERDGIDDGCGIFLGKEVFKFTLTGGGRGVASLSNPFPVDEIAIYVNVSVRKPVGAFGLFDLLGPGASSFLINTPLKSVVSGASVVIYAKPEVTGDIHFDPKKQFAESLKSLTVEGGVGIEAAYENEWPGIGKIRAYIGGKGSLIYRSPGDPFLQARLQGYVGADVTTWLFVFGPFEYVFLDVAWPSGTPQAKVWMGVPGAVYAVGRDALNPEAPRIMNRAYLATGPEFFVLGSLGSSYKASGAMKVSTLSLEVSPLEAFRSIGRTASDPVASKGVSAQPQNGSVASASPKIGQVDLPLLANIFPGSSPDMAGHGQDLMLLYVTDNGSPNDLQFTDIRWTRFDGTNWSVPATIQTNTQAEFSPQVAYDGNGDAIAVWERVADLNFDQTNLTAMAAQMEIVWAKWDHTSGQWSVPTPLTSNGYLDHAPLLCGPMTDGAVLATWTANSNNLLMGTNGAGSQVLWSQWNPASQSWSAAQTLLANLPYRLSQSLAGVSNLAVYAWSRDLDGVLTNVNDQQVFYCMWSNGVWGAATQFTTDTVGNRNARVSVGADGHSYLVWQSGTNLVLSKDFSTNATLVRADSQTAGFADFAMTLGPGGNLALLWQEMSQAGSDAHYSILDPASTTWSKDAQLFNDPPLERSFAPVWDDVGNLTVAYNKVQILYTNKTVTLEGGGMVTITNVPQSGRVDLCVTKRQLIKDLALAAGDFTAGADNYLPGAAVTLSATLRNTGDVAVSNAVVAFYDGNPTNGGVLITNIAIAGWLEGEATNTVSALWVVPEPATNHVLYAIADPAGAFTEFDEANNQQSLRIGGTDLAVSLVSQTAETNGALRVIAQVQNLGAPTATNSVLAIRRYGSTNAPLLTVDVPLLEPGRLAQVALDLPPGSQPAGEAVYTLRADETAVTSDVDTNNNLTSFAVNLWIDSDGDGIPDNWTTQNFGHATGSAGDKSRAQDDADGDGVSNLAEYLAGTNPNSAASYLRMTSIGTGGTHGVLVAWGSATNKLYSVQRTASLLVPFSDVAQHILSTPPENVYLDPTATNANQFFYRVRVE